MCNILSSYSTELSTYFKYSSRKNLNIRVDKSDIKGRILRVVKWNATIKNYHFTKPKQINIEIKNLDRNGNGHRENQIESKEILENRKTLKGK